MGTQNEPPRRTQTFVAVDLPAAGEWKLGPLRARPVHGDILLPAQDLRVTPLQPPDIVRLFMAMVEQGLIEIATIAEAEGGELAVGQESGQEAVAWQQVPSGAWFRLRVGEDQPGPRLVL